MILPGVAWRGRAALARLTAALGASEGLTRYVGGAVRDTLLGLPVADIDLATALAPEAVIARVKQAGFKAVPTGLVHGTVTAVLPDGPVEVTTLRRDVATDGRHAQVAFTADWREDAARRDFTLNALSADPDDGTVHDYFGGLDDLATGTVRFIGRPLDRIGEDHLRILRFFRFHARFGRGTPDPASLAACAARARDLMTLSRERIAQELLKLLATPDPVPTLTLMLDHAILAPVLPEIESSERLARLVAREAAHDRPDPIRRLAALMPDATAAEAIGTRLKLSNAQRRRLAVAALPPSAEAPRALAHRLGVGEARDLLLVHADDARLVTDLPLLQGWIPPRLPIGGGELVRLGLAAGPIVAATLAAIERQWVAEGFPDDARVEAIADAAVAQALRSSR